MTEAALKGTIFQQKDENELEGSSVHSVELFDLDSIISKHNLNSNSDNGITSQLNTNNCNPQNFSESSNYNPGAPIVYLGENYPASKDIAQQNDLNNAYQRLDLENAPVFQPGNIQPNQEFNDNLRKFQYNWQHRLVNDNLTSQPNSYEQFPFAPATSMERVSLYKSEHAVVKTEQVSGDYELCPTQLCLPSHYLTKGKFTSACVICGVHLTTGGKQKHSHLVKCFKELKSIRDKVEEELKNIELYLDLFIRNPLLVVTVNTSTIISTSAMDPHLDEYFTFDIKFREIMRWVEIQNNPYFILDIAEIASNKKIYIFKEMTSFLIYFILYNHFPSFSDNCKKGELTRMDTTISDVQKLTAVYKKFCSFKSELELKEYFVKVDNVRKLKKRKEDDFGSADNEKLQNTPKRYKKQKKGISSRNSKDTALSILIKKLSFANLRDSFSNPKKRTSKKSMNFKSRCEMEKNNVNLFDSFSSKNKEIETIDVKVEDSEKTGSKYAHFSESKSDDATQQNSDVACETTKLFTTLNGKKKALLVGINYKNNPNDLTLASSDDIIKVKTLITDYYGFNEENICILTDGQNGEMSKILPVRKNIIEKMKWLVEGAEPGDSLLLYFSGHGSRQIDIDGDEVDGMDETICPLDHSQAGKITDDEMNELLCHNLPAGCRFTAIFDACHSGTMLDFPYQYTDDGQLKETTVIKELYKVSKKRKISINSIKLALRCGNAKRITKETRSTAAYCVLLSGCKDHESSETDENFKLCGAFTSSLIDILLTNKFNPTFSELLKDLRIKLKTYNQTPQISAGLKIDFLEDRFLL
ncbi:Ca(2+)-dependent cysteine protease [Clydaea vesicula]|uniref:Ca(2+)-dependent cysteine protease n=1 Tax=Clydaea vesicula TaxID=447962 RepID=A0AAD5U9K0_9FUNG|nr:Ca(2+)-dependent cysteine protease [Clydaea vesicula]